MAEKLFLKWGTLKGWKVESEQSQAALKKYFDSGSNSASAALQQDNADQKEALCELIDVIDAEIENDWSGEIMSKDEAKKYVMEYRTN
tara:strand:+ start:11 stop:274 length:264 start_codon:yes stop_codon:yes gene_type:complete